MLASMTTSTRLRLRDTGELIAFLPHQLGYRPRSSLVIVCFDDIRPGGTRDTNGMGLTVRVDLPPAGQEHLMAADLLAVVERELPDSVSLLAFEGEGDDAGQLLALLGGDCEDLGIGVRQVRVRDGRWLSLREPDGSEPRWREVPDPSTVPAAAALVLRGSAPVGEREDLERMLDADRPLTHPAVEAMFLERLDRGWPFVLPDHRLGAVELWGRALQAPEDPRSGRELSAGELTDLLLSLLDLELRDALLAALAPEEFGSPAAMGSELCADVERALAGAIGQGWDVVIHRLATLVRRVPPALSAPLCTLLAVTCWSHGEGTMANIAVSRALSVQPDYSLAKLLDAALGQALQPPSRSARRRRRHLAAAPETGDGTGPGEGAA